MRLISYAGACAAASGLYHFVAPFPLIWRAFNPTFGVEVSLYRSLTPGVPILLFLMIYVSFPWWQQPMGRAFLPTALGLMAAQSILGNHLTLHWLVPVQSHEVVALVFMLRLWVTIQFLVLFIAWQYTLFWVMATGMGLTLLDAALSLSFITIGGTLYSFYIVLVIGRLISVTGAGIGFAWLMKRQREQRAELAEANRRLVRYAAATEQLAACHERNRLARELHDTLAHSLSGVTVQLEAVQALWGVNAEAASRMLHQALLSTRSGLTEARRALKSLRASPLEDLGLCLALCEPARSAAERAALRLELDVENQPINTAPEVEQCIYRVAQEALANVARHAGARSVRVALSCQDGHLTLTVADDGRGFNPSTGTQAGFGLQGLHERAEIVGGQLAVVSQPGHGTTVKLTVNGEVERTGR